VQLAASKAVIKQGDASHNGAKDAYLCTGGNVCVMPYIKTRGNKDE
jgi:hypothetical protein